MRQREESRGFLRVCKLARRESLSVKVVASAITCHLFRSFALAALTLAPLARAQPNRRPIKQAHQAGVETLDDAKNKKNDP